MKPGLLVSISSDPRISARPAEGVRIAAGVGTWKRIEVSLLLNGPAAYALSEYTDDLKDEDNFTRYLPLIVEFQKPIYVAESFKEIEELGDTPWKFERLSAEKIAELYNQHHYFLHF